MKLRTPPPRLKNKGFSLVELSIVLVIIGILLYITISITGQALEMARITQTRVKLEKIQTALALHLRTYGYLPCPARGELAASDPAFGVEAKSGVTCTGNLTNPFPYRINVGVVPVNTLGMTAESMFDGWGNRITYIVSLPCVNPDNWQNSDKYKCTEGGFNGATIQLKGKNDQYWPSPNSAAFIAISHGRSGNGAWNRQGVRQKLNVPSSATAELSNGNIDASGDTVASEGAFLIYYDQSINDGDNVSKYFDDVTIWATPPQLYYYANH